MTGCTTQLCQILVDDFFSLSRKASLFSWSLGVLSFNTWIRKAFSGAKVPTMNWMRVNSWEHGSWVGSGHVCLRVASHLVFHPVPAQRGPSSAVTPTSLGHTHPLFSVLKFLVWCQIWVPPLCHARPHTFICLYSLVLKIKACETPHHLSPGGEWAGVLTEQGEFQYLELSAWESP